MAVQTFKISDLAAAVANPDTDHVEISRDNGNGTFSSFKAPAGGGGGVAVGQALLQIANQPLDPDYLRLDGSTHPKASYPEIAPFFPTAADWGLGGGQDNTASVGTVSSGPAICLSNDGSKLYVSKDGSGTMEVYRTSDWVLLNTITINNGWTTTFTVKQIKISEDGTKILIGVYTAGETTTEITLIDAGTETILFHVPDSAVLSDADYTYNTYSFNFLGTKILYLSATNTDVKVYNIATQTLELTFSAPYTPNSLCFKNDNDYIIVAYVDNINNGIFAMYNTQGQLVLGPKEVVPGQILNNVFSTRKTSNYVYMTGASIYKISTTDFSVIQTYSATGRHYISESGTGDYLAIGSADAGKGYFFVLNDETFTLVSGFPAATAKVNMTHIAKNDSKLVFAFDSSTYFKAVNQLGSLDDFIIDDLTQDAPNLTFEYRIKAK